MILKIAKQGDVSMGSSLDSVSGQSKALNIGQSHHLWLVVELESMHASNMILASGLNAINFEIC